MSSLPPNLHQFFWDTNVSQLNPNSHKKYIAERLLTLGNTDSWQWLGQNYERQELVDILKNSRQLSKKDSAFYSLIFKIPSKEMRCNQSV